MGSSKKKRSRSRSSSDADGIKPLNFRTLFPFILTPQGIEAPVLKNLHRLLVTLSSSADWGAKFDFSSNVDPKIFHGGITVTFADVCELSNVLFKQLEERFGQLFSSLSGLSANKVAGESSLHLSLCEDVEFVVLLLRCCMSLLTLLEVQQNHVLEKGLVLLRILRKLSLPNLVENGGSHAFFFEKSVFQDYSPSDNGCTTSSADDFSASFQFLEPHNPLLFFMLTMLEVYVDELLLHKQLGEYFVMINSVASINEKLLLPHSAQFDTGFMMEALCNHFILSFSDKKLFGDLFARLFWLRADELRYPFRASAIGFQAAKSLLYNRLIDSAPKYVQAHLICLVSESTDIMTNNKASKPDRKHVESFLSILEKSVILYRAHMSCLSLNDSSTSARGSGAFDASLHPLFELCISPDTKSKVDSLICELDHSLTLDRSGNFFGMKSDLVNSSFRFIKEFQNVYGISCQDKILAILSCLILKAVDSFDETRMQPIDGAALQHVYLLASLMKLMSISLLQALWCLRHRDDSSPWKTLKDFSSCKEYHFILQAISFFRDLDCSSPLQQVICKVMSSRSTGHMDSKMMFLHFSGMMSLGFARGLDCVVKGCLLMNYALLNLFVFEEGNLDALQSLVDSEKECFSSSLPVVRFHETIVDRNSSLVVASKFQKIQSLHLRVFDKRYKEIGTSSSQPATSTLDMVPVVGPEEETEETCNGEVFLNCMLEEGEKVPDFDDLASFIECREGKDYSAWLKNRQRYNQKKYEKMAVLRWNRKKKTWKSVKGKRT